MNKNLYFFLSVSLLTIGAEAFAVDYQFLPTTDFEGNTLYPAFSSQIARNRPLILNELVRRVRGGEAYAAAVTNTYRDFVAQAKRQNGVEARRSDADLITKMRTDIQDMDDATVRNLARGTTSGSSSSSSSSSGPEVRPAPAPQTQPAELPVSFTDAQGEGEHRISSNPARQVGTYNDLATMDEVELRVIHEELHQELTRLSNTERSLRTNQSRQFSNIDLRDVADNRAFQPYRLNIAQITHSDPYLALHNSNLDQMVSDADISDIAIADALDEMALAGEGRNPNFSAAARDELAALRVGQETGNLLGTHLDYLVGRGMFRALGYPAAGSPTDRMIKKRVVRLYNHVLAQNDPLALGRLAITMSNPSVQHRCVDGIMDELSRMESEVLGEDSALQPTSHVGELISRILSGMKRQFLRQIRASVSNLSESAEVRTDTPSDIFNRLAGPLGLEGTPTQLAYAVGILRDRIFETPSLIRLFFQGGIHQGAPHPRTFEERLTIFEPLTPSSLVQALVVSSEAAIAHTPARVADPIRYISEVSDLPRMTRTVINRESQTDPLVYFHWVAFEQALQRRNEVSQRLLAAVQTSLQGDGNISAQETTLANELAGLERTLTTNPFFRPAPHRIVGRDLREVGVDNMSFTITREFALYELTKYRYLLTE